MVFGDLNELLGLSAWQEAEEASAVTDLETTSSRSSCTRSSSAPGCASETGWPSGAGSASRRALLVSDPFVVGLGVAARCVTRSRAAGVESEVFDGIAGEPTEASLREGDRGGAASGGCDGFVGIGGGSALDTAKLCALFATHGGGVFDYVNKPIGAGQAVPGPLLPLIALPTTSGTGSEVTTVAIIDFPLGVKTGISHRYLRPRARRSSTRC